MNPAIIELTPEQRLALAATNGAPLRVVDPETRREYLILPSELYQRLQHLVYEDRETSPDASYPLADEVFREDWDNSQMAEYDRYEDFKR